MLGRLASCNALYHNAHHTVLVTLVGKAVLEGLDRSGTVPACDRLDVLASLLCHDIGYVPDLCRGDDPGRRATGIGDAVVELPLEATDAALGPYHVDRAIQFVCERFASHPLLDVERMTACIDRTRFPVPEKDAYQEVEDLPGLARAADLLGQVAEPHARRRYPALYYEFEETGVNERLGYGSPRDLEADFPHFFSKIVQRYCEPAMQLLARTADGRAWLANIEAQLEQARRIEAASER